MDKMDVYSDRTIPFEVAAFCRGRKFLPEAVALSRALRAKEHAEQLLADTETLLREREVEVSAASVAVQQKMTELGER